MLLERLLGNFPGAVSRKTPSETDLEFCSFPAHKLELVNQPLYTSVSRSAKWRYCCWCCEAGLGIKFANKEGSEELSEPSSGSPTSYGITWNSTHHLLSLLILGENIQLAWIQFVVISNPCPLSCELLPSQIYLTLINRARNLKPGSPLFNFTMLDLPIMPTFFRFCSALSIPRQKPEFQY